MSTEQQSGSAAHLSSKLSFGWLSFTCTLDVAQLAAGSTVPLYHLRGAAAVVVQE